MSQIVPSRKCYPTDLSDQQWALVELLIPGARNRCGGRPRTLSMREVVNTILYLNRTGCQWDMPAHDLLPKSSVYGYFARWRDDGTWMRIIDALRSQIRVEEGREQTPSAACIDQPVGQEHRGGRRRAGVRRG